MCEANGRKRTLYVSCAINILGEALEAGSINIGMFLAARFIAGWGIGAAVVLIPIYQAEICERHLMDDMSETPVDWTTSSS